MNEVKESVDNVLDTLENILETHRDIMIVKFLQRFSTSASVAVIGMTCLMIILLTLIFIGIGFSLWIGDTLDNLKAGFLIVGGVYLALLLVIVLIAKGTLLPFIRDLIINKIYDED